MNMTAAADAYEDAMIDNRHGLVKDLDRRITQLLQEVEPLLGSEMELAAWSDTMMGVVEGLHQMWRDGLKRGMLQFGEPSVWPVWQEISPKPLIEDVEGLATQVDLIFGEQGERERAWLIMALNEGTMIQYLDVLTTNHLILLQFYEEGAFLRNPDNGRMLKEQLDRLNHLLFNLSLLEYAAWAKELRERSIVGSNPSRSPLPALPTMSPPSLAEVVSVEEVMLAHDDDDSSALREFAEVAGRFKPPIITQRLTPAKESTTSDTTRYDYDSPTSNLVKEGDVTIGVNFIPNMVQAIGRRVSEVIRGAVDHGQSKRRGTDLDSVGSFETIDRNAEDARLMQQSKALCLLLGPQTSLKDQEFKCHDCQDPIGLDAAAEPVLCHLSGHYYCAECHGGGESLSAALIILNWDFRPVPASTRAIQCFNAQATSELVALEEVNPTLFARVAELKEIRALRQQIKRAYDFVRPCRSGQLEAMKKVLWPRTHLLKSDHLYCLTDLIEAHSGELHSLLEDSLAELRNHVMEVCSNCRSQGVFCQYCRDGPPIYPFFDAVVKCSRCDILSHTDCHQADNCPNCDRILNERLAMAGL